MNNHDSWSMNSQKIPKTPANGFYKTLIQLKIKDEAKAEVGFILISFHRFNCTGSYLITRVQKKYSARELKIHFYIVSE